MIDTREEYTGDRRSEAKALTIAGVCEQIDDEEKKAFIRTRLLERRPHMKVFINHHDAELLYIKVTSFLLLDGLTDAHFGKAVTLPRGLCNASSIKVWY